MTVTDMHVKPFTQTGHKSDEEVALALAKITSVQDVIDLIHGDYASEYLFTAIPEVFSRNNSNLSDDVIYEYYYAETRQKIIRAILQSPHVTEKFQDEWRRSFWETPSIAADMLMNGEYLTQVGVNIALAWSNAPTMFKLFLMKSAYCQPDIVKTYATDSRLSVIRAAAKHPMLTKENGSTLLNHEDATCRLNALTQPWVTSDQLYLMRSDRNPLVVKKVLKELAKRGLAETDELDEALEDEVGTFFLLAAEDEDTMVRIGASRKSQEDSLRAVANSGFPRAVAAVAGNPATPTSLLDEITRIETPTLDELRAKGLYYKPSNKEIRLALASNPNSSNESIERILGDSRYEGDVIVACVSTHKKVSAEAVNTAMVNSSAKSRVALLNTEKVNLKWIKRTVENEDRVSILCALIENYADSLSQEDLESLMASDSEKVRNMATAALNGKNTHGETRV